MPGPQNEPSKNHAFVFHMFFFPPKSSFKPKRPLSSCGFLENVFVHNELASQSCNLLSEQYILDARIQPGGVDLFWEFSQGLFTEMPWSWTLSLQKLGPLLCKQPSYTSYSIHDHPPPANQPETPKRCLFDKRRFLRLILGRLGNTLPNPPNTP